MKAKLIFLAVTLSWSLAQAQTDAEQVAPILGRKLQGADLVAYQLRQYLMKRVPKLPSVTAGEQWSRQSQQLRKHMLEDVVFHGWPREWVNARPKFEDVGFVEGGPGYRMRKLRYEIVPGFLSTAILYEPETLSGRLPAVLNLNGHVGPPGKAVEYKQKRCINFAKRGIMALSLEWIGMGELSHPENVHWFGAHLDLVGANCAGLFYLAMRRGLDYLHAHPQVDPTRLGVTGLSGGGWQTILLSSLDERVLVAIPVAGYSAMTSRIERLPEEPGDIEQNATDSVVGHDYPHLTAMRAPRPTLLIYNAEDDCCYRGPLAKPYIFDAVRPFFRLFNREGAFSWHENTDPSTHNYHLNNRLACYRFFSEHFGLPLIEEEIPVDAEIKSFDELAAGVPKDNLTILGLARKFAAEITHDELPPEGAARAQAVASARDRLRSFVRFQPVEVKHAWALANSKNRGLETHSYVIELTNGLTAGAVWLKAITTPPNAPITVVLHDQGKKAAQIEVSDRLNRGEQVLAVDLLFIGEASPAERYESHLFAEMLAATGDRPLGLLAAQLIAIAGWSQKRWGAPRLRMEVTGLRNQVVALVASALEPRLFSEVVIHEGARSLSYLLEAPVMYQDAPELFCLGLYKEFTLDGLVTLAEATKVVGPTRPPQSPHPVKLRDAGLR